MEEKEFGCPPPPRRVDFGNPLPLLSRWTLTARPFTTAGLHPRRAGFQIFLCAVGTGGRLKGICDLIITPSPHLDDPAASISLSAPLSLSRPLSLCHFPSLSLSLSVCLFLYRSLPACIYLSSNLSFSQYSVRYTEAGVSRRGGGRRMDNSVLSGGGGMKVGSFSANNRGKMRTSLIVNRKLID